MLHGDSALDAADEVPALVRERRHGACLVLERRLELLERRGRVVQVVHLDVPLGGAHDEQRVRARKSVASVGELHLERGGRGPGVPVPQGFVPRARRQ